MTRRVRIIGAASEEIVEGAAWYEARRAGLGSEFTAAIRTALNLVVEGIVPLIPTHGGRSRTMAGKIAVDRFPYNVIVIDRPYERVVVAVAHQSRKPGYWLRRLGVSENAAA